MPVVINGSTGITSPGGDTSAADNTINGVRVGEGAGSIATNTALGASALNANTTGSTNTAVGASALVANTTGANNTAVGYFALRSTAGNTGKNTAVGSNALQANTSGEDNTALGYQAGNSTTSGINNIAIGSQSLFSNTTANNNTAVGYQAGYSSTASRMVAVGTQALTSNTTADNNTAVGYQAGYSLTTGGSNVIMGYQALDAATTTSSSTVIGNRAGGAITTGNNNTIVGADAGASLTTGSGNCFIGATGTYASGEVMTTGSKNTIVGSYTGNLGGLDIRTNNNYVVLSDGDGTVLVYMDNQQRTFIGNGTVNDSATLILQGRAASGWGPVIIGRTGTIGSTTDRWFIGSNSWLKGGTTYDTLTCTAGGAAGGVNLTSGATSWTSASDARLKNITGTYTNALADISQLQPVKFTWKSDTENKPQVGVLAQSVVGVVPEAIDTMRVDKEDETEYLGVRYTELIPLLIASIQELKAEVDSLKAQLNK